MFTTSSTRSLTAKLSFLMTIVVMATVTAMTIQSAGKFSQYILQNIEESSTAMAERSATDIAAILDGWAGQVAVATSKLSTVKQDATKNDADLAATLRADKDLLLLNLYAVEGASIKLVRQAQKTSETASPNKPSGSEIPPEIVAKIMADFSQEITTHPDLFKNERVVRNVTPVAKAPTMLLAIKFTIPNQPQKFAVMALLANMTKIQVSLPQSRYTTGYVISGDGSFFASADEANMLNSDPIRGNALVTMALKRIAPSGFISDFTDKLKKQKVGSFAQTPGKMQLYVVVERDRKAAFQVLTRMYVTSVVWGGLILLIAAMASYLSAGSVTKHLRELVTATKRIAAGDFAVRLQPVSGDEVAELGHSVNNMASRIQSLMNTEVEKARFEKELETAKMVQSTFFPKKAIQTANLSVTGSYQPATECGGDLWGHYCVKEGIDLIFIADAMGHGAPAALVTAIAYATCQSVSSILRDAPIDPSPAVLLKRLNQIILDAVDGKISMTFFASLIDFNRGTITYANAGHNFPFILTSDKEDPRFSKSGRKSAGTTPVGAITLTLQGTPLGVDRDAEYKEKTIEFRAGDKIFFFTDGLIENHLNGQPPIGRKNLLDAICEFGKDPIEQIQEKTLAKAKAVFGDQNLQDDVTIVVAEISKSWAVPVAASPLNNPGNEVFSLSEGIPPAPPALTLDLGAAVPIPAGAGMVSFDLGGPVSEAEPANSLSFANDQMHLKIKLPGVS